MSANDLHIPQWPQIESLAVSSSSHLDSVFGFSKFSPYRSFEIWLSSLFLPLLLQLRWGPFLPPLHLLPHSVRSFLNNHVALQSLLWVSIPMLAGFPAPPFPCWAVPSPTPPREPTWAHSFPCCPSDSYVLSCLCLSQASYYKCSAFAATQDEC